MSVEGSERTGAVKGGGRRSASPSKSSTAKAFDRRRMTEARWSATGDALLVAFTTGERFLLPVAAFARGPGDAARLDRAQEPEITGGGFTLLLRAKRGAEPVDLGWDTVRYHCDARYRAEADRVAADHAVALGEKVAAARKGAGLTQEALAQKSGVARVSIARIEAGMTTPGFATLEKVAKAVGRTLAQLLG